MWHLLSDQPLRPPGEWGSGQPDPTGFRVTPDAFSVAALMTRGAGNRSLRGEDQRKGGAEVIAVRKYVLAGMTSLVLTAVPASVAGGGPPPPPTPPPPAAGAPPPHG